MVQWVKDLGLPQLWHKLQLWYRFDPWPGDFHMPQALTPPQKNSTSRFPLYRNTTVFSILNFNPSITSLLKFFISSNRVCRLPCLFHAEQTILSMSNAGFFFPLCNPYVYFYFFFLPYSTAWDIKNNNVKKKW